MATAGSNGCIDCAAGQYQDSAAQASCIACASEQYSEHGQSQCVSACPAGRYAAVLGDACAELRCLGNQGHWCDGDPADSPAGPYCAARTETHVVSCCSDTEIAGWQAPAHSCTVWSAGDANGPTAPHECPDDLNHADAIAHCIALGGRLCSAAEVEDGCTVNDCGNSGANDRLVWTSSGQACQGCPAGTYRGDAGGAQEADASPASPASTRPAARFRPSATRLWLLRVALTARRAGMSM